MEDQKQVINFFIDCTEEKTEKIRKILSALGGDCYVFVSSQYTTNGCGIYIFECEANNDISCQFVDTLCKHLECHYIVSNVTLQYAPEL